MCNPGGAGVRHSAQTAKAVQRNASGSRAPTRHPATAHAAVTGASSSRTSPTGTTTAGAASVETITSTNSAASGPNHPRSRAGVVPSSAVTAPYCADCVRTYGSSARYRAFLIAFASWRW